jgi:signal transduction histidine kinase
MEQIQFLIQTIDDFRRFFKVDHEEGFFRLDIAIRDTVRLVSTQMKNHDIEMHLDLSRAEHLKTYGTANDLKQVLLNMLNNSRDAINQMRESAGPRYHGEIWIKAFAEGDRAVMEFCDNGGGIKEEILSRLFRPYVTSKGDRGTGIGLYMSRNLIERKFHGTIVAWNGLAGACFRIELRRHISSDR